MRLIASTMRRAKIGLSSLMPDQRNYPYLLLDNRHLRRVLIDSVRDDVAHRPVAFVATSGRSGSQFLSELLNQSQDIFARHEPRPTMTGPFLQAVMTRPLEDSYEWRRLKIVAVNLALLTRGKHRLVAETSHMFIKTFWDVVLGYYTELRVIILRRDLAQVLKSCVELGYFGDANDYWRRWMHVPGVEGEYTEALAPDQHMDQYDRCIAYLLDIEARLQRLRHRLRPEQRLEIDLADLRSRDGLERLFGFLTARPPRREMDSTKSNQRAAWKGVLGPRKVSLAYCRERLDSYIAQARALQKRIPDVPPIRGA